MNSDSRITYWLKNQRTQNFGDTLSEILFAALRKRAFFKWTRGDIGAGYDVVHLIGSCISNYHIAKDLEYVRGMGGKRIAFWGCGLRSDEELDPVLLAHCAFLGVRGPLTRDVLGLKESTPLGDPGLLMPCLYTPRPSKAFEGKTICVPHFLDKKSDEALLAMSRSQTILRPNLPGNMESVLSFTDAIAGARFVLAGALHAAIVACAYGRPFAYFDSGYIDVPFKWADFAASIHMPCHFATTVEEGLRVFELQSSQYKKPPLIDLLTCAPYKPSKALVKRVGRASSVDRSY
jgi:hypothetical protein